MKLEIQLITILKKTLENTPLNEYGISLYAHIKVVILIIAMTEINSQITGYSKTIVN